MRTTSSTILSPHWDAHLLEIRQHELGIRVDEECVNPSHQGRELRAWVNERRARNFGSVMPLNELAWWAAGRWYAARRPSERRAVKDRLGRRLASTLNDPDSGLRVVELCERCQCCGGTHQRAT